MLKNICLVSYRVICLMAALSLLAVAILTLYAQVLMVQAGFLDGSRLKGP